ncbi:MAG: hypothetical protein K9N47_01420 [Prosthecobacter sp.]|uniref:hypothetical protein n=1 Tax=Prosthecobacter sp. TaxID=1965333 RepID=UPI0025E19FA7|nr:hypothetical protein [Prosthecobacter sp.]MCF7784746.1 hypothetical protein [Prosthecobacter sp.]
MSIKRHLLPVVGSFILMADIPPPRPSNPETPPAPPSSPGCTMSKTGRMAEAIEAAKLRKA